MESGEYIHPSEFDKHEQNQKLSPEPKEEMISMKVEKETESKLEEGEVEEGELRE